jgi:Fe-S-cluster-containing dehydrogenase component
VYMINKKLCVNCGKCIEECPFHVMVKAADKPSPSKCIPAESASRPAPREFCTSKRTPKPAPLKRRFLGLFY